MCGAGRSVIKTHSSLTLAPNKKTFLAFFTAVWSQVLEEGNRDGNFTSRSYAADTPLPECKTCLGACPKLTRVCQGLHAEALVLERRWQHCQDGGFRHSHAAENLGQEAQGRLEGLPIARGCGSGSCGPY